MEIKYEIHKLENVHGEGNRKNYVSLRTQKPMDEEHIAEVVEANSTLKKGDSQTWKGTDKVTVRVGDAGAVSFSVNGKDLGTAGKTGQVANKTFTKDGN